VIYRYNRASGLDTDNDYVGFVAQDTMSAIPEAVGAPKPAPRGQLPEGTPRPQDDERVPMMTFSDRPVIAALVNAVRELSDRIAALESLNNP
jgi:hypothetical protein